MNETTLTDYVLYTAYAVEGLAICLGNGLLLLGIITEKSLRQRKEMLIIVGMCATDLFFGLGTLLTNIYRVVMILAGLQFSASSAWRCMLLPQIFMHNVGAQMTAIMNLVVSGDRLVAVSFPIEYRAISAKYSKTILAGVLAFFLLTSIGIYTSTYFDAPIYSTYTRMCLSAVFPRWYALLQYSVITGAGLLSVVVYIFVYFAYRSQVKRVAAGISNRHNDRLQNEQYRLTVTLGLITISTLVFFIIPFGVLTYYLYIVAVAPFTIPLALMTRVSTIINIVIYVYRQKEVRPGMLNILRCKMFNSQIRTSAATIR